MAFFFRFYTVCTVIPCYIYSYTVLYVFRTEALYKILKPLGRCHRIIFWERAEEA